MGLIRFLFSKVFWKQILIMAVLTVILVVGVYFWLLSYTRHGQQIEVPDLNGLKVEKAKKLLRQNQMELVILDTLEYDPDMPAFSVRDQNPSPGSAVKPGRKIYVKINASKYRTVTLPKLRGVTLRQAKATLHAMGLKVGKVEEKPYFAEVVLDLIHGKDTLRAGDRLPKNSVITLVVGSGEEEFETDTLEQAADSVKTVEDALP